MTALFRWSIIIEMHEFGICQRLVETILSELEKLGPPEKKLLKARVVIGKMLQVTPDTFTSAYELLVKGTRIEDSKIEVLLAPITGKCQKCGWQGKIEENRFQCETCGSGNIQLVDGKELYVDSLTVEE